MSASHLIGQIEAAVAEALAGCGRSAAWRSYAGKHQTDLTAALQELSGCEHVGLASSGTAALEMLLAACRLKPGDEVLLSGYDYPGTFAAIERAGAKPALVDVAGQSWNLCRQSLEQAFTPACRVLIVSHLHGQLQPVAEFARWCAERNVYLIQDACQALGASIEGQPIGRFGDATIFSFGGGKTISAGRGGAWTSQRSKLAQHARLAAGVGSGSHEMSELQAAVVLAQLPFLNEITERCRAYFAEVHATVASRVPGLIAPWHSTREHSAFYQAGWLLPPGTKSRDETGSPDGRPHVSKIDWTLGEAQGETVPGSNSSAWSKATTSTSGQPQIGSPLMIGLSQSQHAEWQRIGIGSGFQGYHRRSARRCRMHAPLQNTARIAQATVTVHHRAALLGAPVAEALAQIVLDSASGHASSGLPRL